MPSFRSFSRVAAALLLAAHAATAGAWLVQTRTDGMTGKPIRFIITESRNAAHFRFPYQGDTRALLVIQEHPTRGVDVQIRLPRGQIMCGYSRCPVHLRIDGGPVRTVNGDHSADGDNRVVFLPQPRAWIQRIRHGHTLTVELTIYQEGLQTFTFAVDDMPPT